jgi:hypothetical protein
MVASFIHSFQSEWLKKKHTASSWLILICALFMPLIVLATRLASFERSYHENSLNGFWYLISYRNWAATGMFLLPLVLILSTSLITNIEYKNNTWKQLHTTPQRFSVIYFAKLFVLMVMLLELFLVFNIGVYLSGVIPSLIFKGLPFPAQSFPFYFILKDSLKFFIDCLPILALQYLLGLQFKNFLVPIGVGFSLLVISLLALAWKYGYVIPYIYVPLNFRENQNFVDGTVNRHYCAIAYIVVLTTLGYILYITKKQKG